MPRYLFSNDQRISVLADRIQWVADYVLSGKKLKDIPDKSDNNNAATLEFYYNLYPNTENTQVAITSPKEVIRNFVLKFQYPNPRTQESLCDTMSEKVYLAPYRMTISLLLALEKVNNTGSSYLTLEEVLYYIFADSRVCKNPSVNCMKIAELICKNRKENKNLSDFIKSNIIWKQYDRQIREMMMVLCKCSESFHLSKGVLEYSHVPEEDDFIDKIVKYNFFWVPSNKEKFDLSIKEYISYMNMADTPYNVVSFSNDEEEKNEIVNYTGEKSLQQIFYGAPGTGKSHAINELTAGKDVIRTTFHPDTDYSTFVGAYKPTTKPVPVITVIGTEAVPVRDKNGKEMMEDKIVYEYVSQAFLQAYVAAWRKYCDVQEGEEPMDEFLVIEEINRGNCAQIFGDLFQLLDRGDEGFSEYPIKADSDMKKLLEKEFEGLEIKNKEGINALFNGGKDIVAEVLAGDVLLLPNNLYIWATMNTSDQSLFPIDSAFKRRWDWNYVPISDAGKKWMIEVNGAQYDWWKFLEAINDKVYHATYSEDKKLGYFFCKAKDGVISADKFVSKVIFYLWNDVFKDSEFEGDTFKDEDGEKLSFDKFYSVENNQVKVNGTKIVKFLSNLNLSPDSEADEDNSEEGVETESGKKLPKTPKVFTVEFPDGTVINEKNRFETYLKVLSKIGIEQVEKTAEEMKYQRRNTPLVTKSQHEEILNDAVYSYVQEGDYYIVKGIDAITMYNMVMLLDNRLDLQLKVCYE